MRGIVVAALVATALTTPAHAVELQAGVGGSLDVANDFGVCGSVVVPGDALIVGSLTAVGTLQGPGTKAGTVRATIPFVAVGSWSDCILGSYAGATVGDGKFVLTAATATGEYVHAKQCVVNNGALTCV